MRWRRSSIDFEVRSILGDKSRIILSNESIFSVILSTRILISPIHASEHDTFVSETSSFSSTLAFLSLPLFFFVFDPFDSNQIAVEGTTVAQRNGRIPTLINDLKLR